jgi:hypothetical protein
MSMKHPDLGKIACPKCKHENEIIAQYDRKRYFTQCSECGCKIRLVRPAMAPESDKAKKERMSKKERLRARWAAREDRRFARSKLPKGRGKGAG